MKKTAFGLIALLVMVVAVSGCSTTDTNSKGSTSTIENGSVEYQVNDQKILNSEMTDVEGVVKVKGQAKNVESYKLNTALVGVRFYDDSGTLLYSGNDTVNNLSPGEIWTFEVEYQGNNKPSRYQVVAGPVTYSMTVGS